MVYLLRFPESETIIFKLVWLEKTHLSKRDILK